MCIQTLTQMALAVASGPGLLCRIISRFGAFNGILKSPSLRQVGGVL